MIDMVEACYLVDAIWITCEVLLFFVWRWLYTSVCFKGCVHYIFAGLFFVSKSEPFQNKEECFLFHLGSSFHSWDNQILTF